MIVLGNKIPQDIVEEVTRVALAGEQTSLRLEMLAGRLLAEAGLGRLKGPVGMRLADGVLKKLRREGALKPVRYGRTIRWVPNT